MSHQKPTIVTSVSPIDSPQSNVVENVSEGALGGTGRLVGLLITLMQRTILKHTRGISIIYAVFGDIIQMVQSTTPLCTQWLCGSGWDLDNRRCHGTPRILSGPYDAIANKGLSTGYLLVVTAHTGGTTCELQGLARGGVFRGESSMTCCRSAVPPFGQGCPICRLIFTSFLWMDFFVVDY